MTTPIAQEKDHEQYTYANYLQWDAENRYELIEGEAVLLAVPATSHQLVSAELMRQLANFLEGKNCKVISAPFDVRLFEEESPLESIDAVVQPDITVICGMNACLVLSIADAEEPLTREELNEILGQAQGQLMDCTKQLREAMNNKNDEEDDL